MTGLIYFSRFVIKFFFVCRFCFAAQKQDFWRQLKKKTGSDATTLQWLFNLQPSMPKAEPSDESNTVPSGNGRGKGRSTGGGSVVSDNNENGDSSAGPTKTKESLRRKLRVKLVEQIPTFQCPECNDEFNTEIELNNHINGHGDNEEDSNIETKFTCKYCKAKTFTTSEEWIKHIQVDHFTCHITDCYKYYSTANGLKYHATHVHNCMPAFVCAKCGKVNRTQQALVSHRCTPPKKKKEAKAFVCKFCKAVLQSNEAQLTHEMLCEQNEKRIFVCKFCDKVYQGWDDLAAHLTSQHGQGKVICKCCHSGVKNKSALKEHRKTCTFYAESVRMNNALKDDSSDEDSDDDSD